MRFSWCIVLSVAFTTCYFVKAEDNSITTEQPETETGVTIKQEDDDTLQKFYQEVLNAHNKVRKEHGVPPLELKDELTEKSQSWAIHLAKKNIIENSFSEYSENIYGESTNAKRNATAVVKFWSDKMKFYKPGKLNVDDWWNAAPFTQIIWAKSKYLGVGMSENDDFRFVVCFYDPPGNLIDQDPLEKEDDSLPLAPENTFYILPGGMFLEGNENENLTHSIKENFIVDVLEAHNQFRSLHGVETLQLQDDLTMESQAWADHLAETNTFEHSSSNHGENIYKEPIFFERNGTTPVKFWYDEIQFYKFGKEPDNWQKVGHFTQLIWADTRYVGVGIAENKYYRFIVCNYDPRGNIVNLTNYEDLIPAVESENLVEGDVINEDDKENEVILQDFRNKIVDEHNKLRAMHQVLPLHLKNELNDASQKWAEYLASHNFLAHNSTVYGENIYVSSTDSKLNATAAVMYWYNKNKLYDFTKGPEDWISIEDFTQLLWTETKFLGVGMAENEKLRYIVCNYDPRGNILGLNDYSKLLPPIRRYHSVLEGMITHDTGIEDAGVDTKPFVDNDSASEKESTNNTMKVDLEGVLNATSGPEVLENLSTIFHTDED
uniref:SCP domain-containing protein n=2 Tax=Clastoptera arizonana TaxID=38151 RepID=A0A1B6EFW3_9HEMI